MLPINSNMAKLGSPGKLQVPKQPSVLQGPKATPTDLHPQEGYLPSVAAPNLVQELTHGIKDKEGEKIAEGVGGLAVGARSLLATPVMAAMLTRSVIQSKRANEAAKVSESQTAQGQLPTSTSLAEASGTKEAKP